MGNTQKQILDALKTKPNFRSFEVIQIQLWSCIWKKVSGPTPSLDKLSWCCFLLFRKKILKYWPARGRVGAPKLFLPLLPHSAPSENLSSASSQLEDGPLSGIIIWTNHPPTHPPGHPQLGFIFSFYNIWLGPLSLSFKSGYHRPSGTWDIPIYKQRLCVGGWVGQVRE